MATTRVIIVASLLSVLGLAVFAGSQAEVSSGKELEVEIKRLIRELGHKGFRERENATKRLAEIGVPALEALRQAEEQGDAETKRRAAALIAKISVANRLPIRVNGMDFKLVVDKAWRIPKVGDETTITTELQITNRTNKSYRVLLLDTVTFLVTDPTDKEFVSARLRVMREPTTVISPSLAKDQTFTISFEAKLRRYKDKVMFNCRDPLNTSFGFPGLYFSQGTYRLRVICENVKTASDKGDPLWVGKAETAAESLIIK